MKNNIIIIILFIKAISFAQVKTDNFSEMVAAEMKSASKLMSISVNQNTTNYDITYHKLEFTVNPTVASITGKVTTTYTALSNMSNIVFDMANALTASTVKMNNVNLAFTRTTNNEIVITLPSAQAAGTAATIEISYSGDPTASGFGSFTTGTHAGSPVLFTLSEPFGARDWWPCKQDLNDKIDNIDVYITAPAQYVAVSNGLEPETPVIIGSNKITHFRHNYPIPAYLIAIAVSNYQVDNSTQGGLGTTASPFFPITNYLYPEQATANIASLAVTPSIMNFFETKFGQYPFRNEKYGHCQFGWGGGMEHTTVSFMGGFDRGLIAHELGHHWFGNKITCGTWKDIWLNEGITEYMSGMVVEFLDGNTSFRTWKTSKINSVVNHTGTTNLYLTDAQATNINRIFSGTITYNKGSMVTSMLRYKMGDVQFFQAMNNYLSSPLHAYKYAVTNEFKAQLELVAGANSMTEFFNDWVYGQGHPTYNITVQNIVGNYAKIVVNQTQSDASVSYFDMPLEIKISDTNGATQILKVDNTFNGQQFIVPTNFLIASAVFDPEKNIISKNNTITLNPIVLAHETFDLNQVIKVYPNPITTELNINTPNSIIIESVTITNILGQIVAENNSNKIDFSSFSSGLYNVIIKTTEGTVYKKIIKN